MGKMRIGYLNYIFNNVFFSFYAIFDWRSQREVMKSSVRIKLFEPLLLQCRSSYKTDSFYSYEGIVSPGCPWTLFFPKDCHSSLLSGYPCTIAATSIQASNYKHVWRAKQFRYHPIKTLKIWDFIKWTNDDKYASRLT